MSDDEGKLEVGREAVQCFFCRRTPEKTLGAYFGAVRDPDTPGKVVLWVEPDKSQRTHVCGHHYKEMMQAMAGEFAALGRLYKDLGEKVKR